MIPVIPAAIRNNPFYAGGCDVKCEPERRIKLYYLYRLLNLAVSRFKWEGLPDEIQPYYLEQILLWNGAALFVYDKNVQMYAVKQLSLGGMPDIYGVPDIRLGYAPSAETQIEEYNKLESVVVWDKPILYPNYDALDIFADRLTKCHLTSDLNLVAHRTPIAITGTEQQRLTMSNVIDKLFSWVPVLKFKQGAWDGDQVKTLDLKAPLIFPETERVRQMIWAEALNFLGFEAYAQAKEERLTKQEGGGNMGGIEGERNVSLGLRERAAEQINNLFGLNVSVKFRSDLPTQLNAPDYYAPDKGDGPEKPDRPEDTDGGEIDNE